MSDLPEVQMPGSPACPRTHDECRFTPDGPAQMSVEPQDWKPVYNRQGQITNQPTFVQPMRCTTCDQTFTMGNGTDVLTSHR